MAKTTKQILLDILENTDLTTRKGQANFDKCLGKVEEGFKTFDKKVDQFDMALVNLGKKF